MTQLTRRATVYFEPALHRALRHQAAAHHCSVSEIINAALSEAIKPDINNAEADDVPLSDHSLFELLKKHGAL